MQLSSSIAPLDARLRDFFRLTARNTDPADREDRFDELAMELFQAQFESNAAYRALCEARHISPGAAGHCWNIPAVPTSAFKELDLTCLPPNERTRVFHSSGTTKEKPSRHFHNQQSLALYESSALTWFGLAFGLGGSLPMLFLTPRGKDAPTSSLVHMFETVSRQWSGDAASFVGAVDGSGAWVLNFDAATTALAERCKAGRPCLVLGTAFSFVHLLDHLDGRGVSFQLPAGSRVMETGGYKGRSRALPRSELHSRLCERLGVTTNQIVCEYGMCELSSQAYDAVSDTTAGETTSDARIFQFPPWARALVISPETGREVAEGETGLIRVYDLANRYSVMAVQTEDLGIRRGSGFELIGRAQEAAARGCSLMAA